MYKEQIDAYIDGHQEEMLEDLKMLVRIDSQRGKSQEGMPFGEGPAKALAAARALMDKYGFKTTNYDNYVVTGDFNDKEKQLDILAHLDVVPVSEDWTVTKPFEPVVIDGKIYGRGTADDKGPAIAALYAMRAIKELGIPMDKSVRLVLGSDEECGSSDLQYYYSKEAEAPMSFTPDADFPLINIEKAQLQRPFLAVFKANESLPRILQIKGGSKVNVVPGKAHAIVEGLDGAVLEDTAKAVEKETGITFDIRCEEKAVWIEAKGNSGHASTPEVGNNALTGLLAMLVRLPFAPSDGFDKVRAVAEMFPHNDYSGKALGVDMEDEESGRLTMNLGIFEYSPERLSGHFDSRAPLCATDENLTEVIRLKMLGHGIVMEAGKLVPAHHVPADSEFVRTLLGSYELYTGKKDSRPLAIGGGTYVHELERGVAFGCMEPGVDNHMHGDDEFMEIDTLLTSAKIFADSILKLCCCSLRNQ